MKFYIAVGYFQENGRKDTEYLSAIFLVEDEKRGRVTFWDSDIDFELAVHKALKHPEELNWGTELRDDGTTLMDATISKIEIFPDQLSRRVGATH